jgi:signal transduction histidine kinase
LREEPLGSIGELLGLVTHDLRNPLAALSSNVGYLQMLAPEMKEEVKETIDDLQISVEALGRISDCLELLGHELMGRAGEPLTVQNVASILRSVRKPALRSAKSHDVTLTFSTDENEGIRFRASEQVLARALSGLIHNALTVAPPKSEVVVRVREDGQRVVFRVEDGGPPLTGEMLRAIGTAEAQNRLKSSRSARYSRGLGLFAVHWWAARSGAILRVGESSNGSALELCVLPVLDELA